MSQFYSDPSRENDPHALPDCEVFLAPFGMVTTDDGEELESGWYYQYAFPGCLPTPEPIGPFATEQEAIDACREEAGE